MQKLYAAEGGRLPRATIQIRLSPGFDSYDDPAEGVKESIREIEDLSFFTGFGNDRIKIGAIKMSVDGGMGGQAAWLLEPYRTKPDYHGINRISPEVLYQVAKRAHELGWQLGIHAIGDQAIVKTVEVMDRIVRESPRPNHRHYLHHLTVTPPAGTLAKIKANGFIAAMQPNFTHTLASYYGMALSPTKLEKNNSEKTYLRMGIPMSLGTDSLPDGPIVAIYGAVTRRGVDGKVYGAEERLTLEEAIHNATVGSAYMTFDEKTRGTLEPGKVADMIVLQRDIFTIDPEDIRKLGVEKTIIAGNVVWENDGSPRPAQTH
jgi:predicted amidohydrolase YtcJ